VSATSEAETRWRSAVEALAVASIAVVVQLPVYDRAMFLMDEGHILQFADILLRGGELYRDATLLPLPGAFYLLAAAFELFGPSIWVARAIAVLEFALLCVCAFFALRRLSSRGVAFGGVIALFLYRIWAYPHWHMYSYSTLAMCLLAAAVVALMGFLERGGRGRIVAAGLLTGLAVACKQDYGVAGLLAMSAVLCVHHFTARPGSPERGPGAFLGYWTPALGVGAVVALHYLRHGLFSEMLQQTLLNHMLGIATFEYTSLPPLLPLFGQTPELRSVTLHQTYVPGILFQFDWARVQSSAWFRETILWDLGIKLFFYAPYLLAGFGALRLWRMRSACNDPARRSAYLSEGALYSLATTLWLALSKPVDYVHVVVLYWPWLLLCAVYLASAVRGRPRMAWGIGAAAIIPVTLFGVYSVGLTVRMVETHQTPLSGDRAGVYVVADDGRVVDEMVAWASSHSEPGGVFPVLPYFPLVSFLAERDGAHRATYTFWPIEYIPDRERQIVDAFDDRGVDRLIYHFTQFPVFPRMPEYAPELFAYLVDEFEIEQVFTSDTWGYTGAGIRRVGPPAGEALVDTANEFELRVEQNGRPDERIGRERAAELLQTARWPFRPVFTLRPLSGGRRTVASLEVDIPAGARLQTAVSAHPTLWFQYPPSWVRFTLRARNGGHTAVLFDRTLNPHTDPADRRWFEIDVDLAHYAEQHIELEFVASAEGPHGELHAMGGWEIPRLRQRTDASVTP
jgi:hypothetical protein